MTQTVRQNLADGDGTMGDDSQRTDLAVSDRWQHWKRNFWLGVINGILFKVGITFSHPSTVLAVFLDETHRQRILCRCPDGCRWAWLVFAADVCRWLG